MNYRHAYHAGNFADVTKHIVLSRVLAYFLKKDTPFFVLDTHAGIGRYDLKSGEAQKTLEAENGIAKFMAAFSDAPSEVQQLCASFEAHVRSLNEAEITTYPGSPLITQSMIRRSDRLSLIELHPEDFRQLQQGFNWAKNTKTHNMDAWAAMKAQLPPKEKRGLVLIDPPFEDRDEFNAILRALYDAQKRFSNGTYLIWYPIKDMPMVQSFAKVLSGMELGETIDVRLTIEQPPKTPKFIGSGMVVVNPPFTLKKELNVVLPWLTKLFEAHEGSGSFSIKTLVAER